MWIIAGLQNKTPALFRYGDVCSDDPHVVVHQKNLVVTEQ